MTDWGDDLVDFIYAHSGLTTTVHLVRDRRLGLDGTMLEVFISRKRVTGGQPGAAPGRPAHVDIRGRKSAKIMTRDRRIVSSWPCFCPPMNRDGPQR